MSDMPAEPGERHVISEISYAVGRIVCSCGATVEASLADDFAWRDHRRGRPRMRARNAPGSVRPTVAGRGRSKRRYHPEPVPERSRGREIAQQVPPRQRSDWGQGGLYRGSALTAEGPAREGDALEPAYFCERCARWHPIIWRRIGPSLHYLAPVEVSL